MADIFKWFANLLFKPGRFGRGLFRFVVIVLLCWTLVSEFPWFYSSVKGFFHFVDLRHSISVKQAESSFSELSIILLNRGSGKATNLILNVQLDGGQLKRTEVESDEVYETKVADVKGRRFLFRLARLAGGASFRLKLVGSGLSRERVKFVAAGDDGLSIDELMPTTESRALEMEKKLVDKLLQGKHAIVRRVDGIVTRPETQGIHSSITPSFMHTRGWQNTIEMIKSDDFISAAILVLALCVALEFLAPGTFYGFISLLLAALVGIFNVAPITVGFMFSILVNPLLFFAMVACFFSAFTAGATKTTDDRRAMLFGGVILAAYFYSLSSETASIHEAVPLPGLMLSVAVWMLLSIPALAAALIRQIDSTRLSEQLESTESGDEERFAALWPKQEREMLTKSLKEKWEKLKKHFDSGLTAIQARLNRR